MPISKRNRRGLIWLLLIASLMIAFPRVLTSLSQNKISVSKEEMALIENELIDQQAVAIKGNKKWTPKSQSFRIPPKAFNPNDYGLNDWKYLGLSQKQAMILMKFSARGIRSDEQLKKIFVIDDKLFQLIKDSTYYPTKLNSYPEQAKKSRNEELKLFDLNSITKEELMTLPGIGEYFSDKILTYREGLGGFARKEQLLEVWKLDEEKYAKIEGRLMLTTSVRKININLAAVDELKNHPYLTYKVANSIIKIREQHGTFANITEIKRSKLIDEELFEKIEPYLTVE